MKAEIERLEKLLEMYAALGMILRNYPEVQNTKQELAKLKSNEYAKAFAGQAKR